MNPHAYKRLHVELLRDRIDFYGKLSPEREAQWKERLEAAWSELGDEERDATVAWLSRQDAYREENGMDEMKGTLTPEERGLIEFEGTFQLVIAEDDDAVVFQINGQDVRISQGILLDYEEGDGGGRFWLARKDAEELGFLH